MIDQSAPASIIFFDLEDEAEALKVAKEIATKMGRVVTVRRSDGTKVDTVEPTKH